MKTTKTAKTTKSHAITSTPAAHMTATHPAPGETAAVAAPAMAATAPAAPATSPVVPIPTEEQVTEWVNALEGVRTLLGESATPLTTQERRRALRAKKGGEATVGLMIGLGQQYGVNLPGVDPAQIQQHTLLVTRLQPLETKLRVISGLVTDTLANAKTESWQGTTALYTALMRTSTRNAALQKELKPAVAFFKKARASSGTSKPSKAKNAASGATATSAPPPTETVTAPPATPEPAAPAAAPATAPAAPAVTKQ